jgi:hypothetical protein
MSDNANTSEPVAQSEPSEQSDASTQSVQKIASSVIVNASVMRDGKQIQGRDLPFNATGSKGGFGKRHPGNTGGFGI